MIAVDLSKEQALGSFCIRFVDFIKEKKFVGLYQFIFCYVMKKKIKIILEYFQ